MIVEIFNFIKQLFTGIFGIICRDIRYQKTNTDRRNKAADCAERHHDAIVPNFWHAVCSGIWYLKQLGNFCHIIWHF